jgi:hypothetical protein
VGQAVTGHEPLGAGGILLVVIGLALASRRARSVATWVGEGVVTGLGLVAGAVCAILGALMFLVYARALAGGAPVSVGSAVVPALLLGCGILLLVRGVRRLWRLRGLPGSRE